MFRPPTTSREWSDDLAENGLKASSALGEGEDLEESYPCPHCGAAVPQLGMAHFSFNKPAGACPLCTGLGTVSRANLGRLIDPERSVSEGGVLIWEKALIKHYGWVMQNAARYYGFPFDLDLPIGQLGEVERDLLLYDVRGPEFQRHYPEFAPPTTIAEGNFEGVIEHNLDLIVASDWVIGLGPERGTAGGQTVAEGTPEQVAALEGSHTGRFLRQVLQEG